MKQETLLSGLILTNVQLIYMILWGETCQQTALQKWTRQVRSPSLVFADYYCPKVPQKILFSKLAAKDLLIIYEAEANQWASYLLSVFTGPISEAAICCYDISTVSHQQDDFLRLSRYTCKLLILSKGMLESLSQLHCAFLGRVLAPASQVVVLLCGVDSVTPLLELVPLDGRQFLQISSDQDAPEYLSAVTDIIRKGQSEGFLVFKCLGFFGFVLNEISLLFEHIIVVFKLFLVFSLETSRRPKNWGGNKSRFAWDSLPAQKPVC